MTAMMIERHYDDETLISLMETNRTRGDKHIPACTVCAEKLDSFRTLSTAMREEDVWDTRASEPVPSTISNLRKFANRMTSEDAQADLFLPELLAGPRDTWMPRLREHPEWRTAGAVRKLMAGMRKAVETSPADALDMTELATEIADHLDTGNRRADAEKLRGMAWHDRAYALFYVGRFTDALAATDRADVCLRHCAIEEWDRGRVAIVRALCLRAKEDFAAATAAIHSSAATFVAFGDIARLASARLAETHLLFSRGDFESARMILEQLERQLRGTSEGSLQARVMGNLGYCFWKLGRIDDALRHHDAAASLLEDLQIRTESARVRWNVASILVSAGRLNEAQVRLEGLKSTFDELEMTSEAALVRLDIAELFIARDEFVAAEASCRAAMESFERAGISYTARALTALAYIREAAQHRTATPALVKHVREYIRRLPQDGELLFAPPPPEAWFPTSR